MDWDEVARQVRARRHALGWTQREAAEHAQVSEPTWGLIENARQDSYKGRTLAKVATALRWSPDSIRLIGEGGEPIDEGEPVRSVVHAIEIDDALSDDGKAFLIATYQGVLRSERDRRQSQPK